MGMRHGPTTSCVSTVQPQSAVDVQITAEEISKVTASYTDELNHCLKQASDHTPPVSQFILSPFYSVSFSSIPGFPFEGPLEWHASSPQ